MTGYEVNGQLEQYIQGDSLGRFLLLMVFFGIADTDFSR